MRLRLFLWLTVRNCHCPDSEDVIETFEKTLFFLLGDEADFPNSFFKMRLLFFQMFWGSIFELFITVLAYPVLP
jgi:hypothetical protein